MIIQESRKLTISVTTVSFIFELKTGLIMIRRVDLDRDNWFDTL